MLSSRDEQSEASHSSETGRTCGSYCDTQRVPRAPQPWSLVALTGSKGGGGGGCRLSPDTGRGDLGPAGNDRTHMVHPIGTEWIPGVSLEENMENPSRLVCSRQRAPGMWRFGSSIFRLVH